MLAPPFFPIDVPYRELFRDGAFSERPLIDLRRLKNEAKRRRLDIPLFPREELERLDREGAIRPIAFSQINYQTETTWLRPDPDDLVWREEVPWQDWRKHEVSFWDNDPGGVFPRYSHWQLLYLNDALEGDRLLIDATRFTRPWIERAKATTLLRGQAEFQLGRWRDLDLSWLPTIKFLASLQPFFWPFVKRGTVILHDPAAPSRRVAAHDDALARFDPPAHAERFGVTSDDVARLYGWMARAGRSLDPIRHAYLVMRGSRRKRYELLRGEAAQAADLYDASFLLRAFHHRLTDQLLPDCDELDHPEVSRARKTALFSHGPELIPRRQDLKPLLRIEGLYPHLVHFFVEGETEEIVLEHLLRFLGYDPTGGAFRVTNFRGIGKLERYSTIAQAAASYAARTVLIADMEGEVKQLATRLVAAGVFNPDEDVVLWERDGRASSFEEANFTVGELLTMMRRAGRKRNADAKSTLRAADVRRAFSVNLSTAAAEGRDPQGLAKVVLRLAKSQQYGAINVSKLELALEIGDRLVNEIRTAGDLVEAGKRRPILRHLWFYLTTAS